MTTVERMRSTDRGFNWFAAKHGAELTFATPSRSATIRVWVWLDQRGVIS